MPKKEMKVKSVSGDNKEKKMLLSLDPTTHSWIKRITDASKNMTQPKVVKLILAEATKIHADDYIEQITKMNAKDELRQVTEQAEKLALEKKRLEDLLG